MKKVKILFVIILPIIITLFLYPIKGQIIFDGKAGQYSVFKIDNSDLFKKEPNLKNTMADIIDIPLYLDWHKIKIVNNSILKDSVCLESNQSRIFFDFIKGDPRTYESHNLKETTEQTGGYKNSKAGHPTYYMDYGEESYFIVSSKEEYVIDGGLLFGGGCKEQFEINSESDFSLNPIYDYQIIVSPYWKSWVARLLLVSIFWLFILSSVISIFDWINRTNKLKTNKNMKKYKIKKIDILLLLGNATFIFIAGIIYFYNKELAILFFILGVVFQFIREQKQSNIQGSGVSKITASDIPPKNPNVGDLYIDTK